ncbi:S-methyl-5-thioribose-1-phosphate isomerase [Mycobacterium sp. SM1]|uniref:S-methyl-5-thioribose-1-phosphate isomerase n=1 Tax=Mycobacterium sp. SM1 TaxID=2816243 RepID=UPI0027DC864D|nr:S-methyl-5-thioribose-1-phosphate isomerase [Mycobacterium sp. SM1]
MGESSITWAGDALVVIDQRALPREVRLLRLTSVDEVIEAIKTLAIRGAPALGVSGAFAVVLAAFAHAGDITKVTAEAERVAAARPTAVNLARGVQRALARLPLGAPAVLHEALEMLAEDGRVNRAAATHAADLVQRLCPDRPLRMLTHCNTGRLATAGFGTAMGALRVLHARGKIENVLVGETRPLLQGARLTTWELAEAGIPHRLMIDSAAPWAMATGQVDCVIVGADRIAADGSVANKIGTYALALAAHRHAIPFIVVAPESTRDPATVTGRQIVVEERDPAEITHVGGVPTAPQGTRVLNPAFDITPPELITAVVTENGVVSSVNIPAGQRDLDSAPAASAESQIPEVARRLYARGWMAGSAGNISVRTGQTAVITGSGLSKGELTSHDLVTVNIADSQQVSGTRQPSAETAIHTAIYRATGAGAVVHVHSPYATAQSIDAPPTLRFSGYELIKGLQPDRSAEAIEIPVFANHVDVARIGADVEHYLLEHPDAAPVIFVAGHGITSWGADLEQARNHAECLEAMCKLASLTGRRELASPRRGKEPGKEPR